VKNTIRLLTTITLAMALQACDSSDPNLVTAPPIQQPPATARFDVTAVNLTNAQPLSPITVIAHTDMYSLFAVGVAATAGLEEMAEGGDNSALIAEAIADATNVFTTGSGAGAIGPAGTETVSLIVLESELASLQVSVATMLVNTNDAFTALNGFDVSSMAIGDSVTFNTIAYDAGTEDDTEAAADVPGPAGGGEGFNAARSDAADRVSMHGGVVTQDDGFATSDLTEQHRFDNPVMRIRIERTL